MVRIIKLAIWITGAFVVGTFILNFFGYQFNREYFRQTQKQCQSKLEKCKNELVRQGIENAQCDLECPKPKIIIKKPPK